MLHGSGPFAQGGESDVGPSLAPESAHELPNIRPTSRRVLQPTWHTTPRGVGQLSLPGHLLRRQLRVQRKTIRTPVHELGPPERFGPGAHPAIVHSLSRRRLRRWGALPLNTASKTVSTMADTGASLASMRAQLHGNPAVRLMCVRRRWLVGPRLGAPAHANAAGGCRLRPRSDKASWTRPQRRTARHWRCGTWRAWWPPWAVASNE